MSTLFINSTQISFQYLLPTAFYNEKRSSVLSLFTFNMASQQDGINPPHKSWVITEITQLPDLPPLSRYIPSTKASTYLSLHGLVPRHRNNTSVHDLVPRHLYKTSFYMTTYQDLIPWPGLLTFARGPVCIRLCHVGLLEVDSGPWHNLWQCKNCKT